MTIPAHYPTQKVPDEVRECHGCHLKVMARGDWQNWKGVDAGDGSLRWFCDKTACQQLRDEFIAKRQQEMIVAQQKAQNPALRPVDDLSDTEVDEEEERLRARLMALKARKARQTTADEEKSAPVLETDIQENEPNSEQNPYQGVMVHQTENGVDTLCGGEGAMFAVGEELPENSVPCIECAEIGEKSEKEPEPMAEQPVVDFRKLPKFTPELITRIREKGYDGGQILITPAAYPDRDLPKADIAELSDGISAMFQGVGLEVASMQRAKTGGEFVGLVFGLQKVSGKK